MAKQARGRGSHTIAERYERMAEETTEAADVLRRQVTGRG
jgi:rubrerythrin